MRYLTFLAVCVAAAFLSGQAHAVTAEQRAIRAAAFEAAYKALDPKSESSIKRFADLVAAEVKAGISADEFLGFMIDAGLDCRRVIMSEGPAIQPLAEYYCSYSFITREESDRQAWSLVKAISRADAVAYIDGNRIAASIHAGALYDFVSP